MELVRAVGVWPGLDHDMVAEAGDAARGMTGPSVAITIGTAYLRTVVPFLKVNSGLEDQFLDTPGGIWGTLLTNLPQRLVATLTIWEDSKAALDYMRSGAHGQAIRDHYDPAKDPTGHTFVTGGGFFGFRPLATSGSVAGRNPLPGATSWVICSRVRCVRTRRPPRRALDRRDDQEPTSSGLPPLWSRMRALSSGPARVIRATSSTLNPSSTTSDSVGSRRRSARKASKPGGRSPGVDP